VITGCCWRTEGTDIFVTPFREGWGKDGIVVMDITIRSATTGDIPRMVELLVDLFSIGSDFAPDKESQIRGLAMLVNDPLGVS
jgi:hypothetical protein